MAHIVQAFDAELQQLNKLVGEMGAIALKQIEEADLAFATRDLARAKATIASDKAIDALEIRIEEKAVALIAKRQPLAVDLRDTIATLKIANDLERIGDLAKNNAKRVVAISEMSLPRGTSGNLGPLSSRVRVQLARVLDAYARRDSDLARTVWSSDGEIDTLHTGLFRELLTYMMEDPRSIGACTHLLFCAKNLERIGDHATNIAENIYYAVTGDVLSIDRPKGSDASGIGAVKA